MSAVEVRPARPEDASALLAIYGPYVRGTAISFEARVPGEEEFSRRIADGLERYPWIVCMIHDQVAGYVYAGKHREREAYQWCCESSVYIRDEHKGMGLGVALYGLLFQCLRMQGMKNVYAAITLPNEASVRLHEKCGFRQFATFENIGFKLGAWQNVGWWKLQLSEYDLKPPPPLRFSELEPAILSSVFQQTAAGIRSKLTG